jgi:hypothetical protein
MVHTTPLRPSPLLDLPLELVTVILVYLDPNSLLACSSVCLDTLLITLKSTNHSYLRSAEPYTHSPSNPTTSNTLSPSTPTDSPPILSTAHRHPPHHPPRIFQLTIPLLIYLMWCPHPSSPSAIVLPSSTPAAAPGARSPSRPNRSSA